MHLTNIVFYFIILEFLFAFIECLLLHTNVAEDLSADYEFDEKYKSRMNLRQSFLRKKKLQEDQKVNEKLLQGILNTPNKGGSIIYSDDVPHYEVKNESRIYRATKNLENDLLNLLKMKDMKYVFKRNGYWRTWRLVKYPNGTEIVFNYIANNLVDLIPNCTNCGGNSGFWNIEDKPPTCPYEIFSMSTKRLACGTTHQNITKTFTRCPLKISLIDFLAKCSNPVVTKWKFEKLYSKSSKNSKVSLISAGRENFEITTLYRVNDDEITLQIVNSTNEVIYSKIMRPGNINYVCILDCGIFNPATLKVSKQDDPLSLDLLDYDHNAKKRENEIGGKTKIPSHKTKKKFTATTTVEPLELIKIAACNGYVKDYLVPEDYLGATTQWAIIKGRKKKFRHYHHHKMGEIDTGTTPMSLCKKLIAKTKTLEMASDSDYMDYSY